MKKTLQTFAYGFVTIVAFALSFNTAFASTVFNNHPSDYATVRVSNYTNNPGSSINWSTSVSADAGDIVSVVIYYHNNGSEDALSSKLKVMNGQFVSESFTHTITASVGASNAPTVFGSATVNISSSQSLEFIPGSVDWYPYNQNQTTYNLPYGQSGTELFTNSGFNLGTLSSGWSDQGFLVFHYQVSEDEVQQAPAVTTNSYSLLSNNQVTLNGYVDGQGLNPYTWFVYGTSSNLGSGSNTTSQDYQYTTSTNFSETVYVNENTTYFYKACALTNGGGQSCGSTLSFTTNGGNGGGSIVEPVVITEEASAVTDGSAILNGEVVSTGGEEVSFLKFMYGLSQNQLYYTAFATDTTTNSPTEFYQEIDGLLADETYYYKACGTNSAGEDCGSIQSFHTDDDTNNNNNDDNDVNIEVTTKSANGIGMYQATLRGQIEDTDGEYVSRYFEYGNDEDDLDFVLWVPGATNDEGSFQGVLYGLYPNEDYYFRACIETTGYPYDEDCGSVKHFETDGGYQNPNPNPTPLPVGNLTSLTTFATGFTGTSAVLNGVSTNNTSNTSVSYFEYGTSYGLGNSTATQPVNSGQTLYNSKAITGLTPNTTYYYRIVTGSVPGQIKSFNSGANTNTVVITTTTNTSTNTTTNTSTGGSGIVYLALDINPDFENVYEGDVINFDVDYRNLYNGELEDVVIQVMFPEEIEFRKATVGFYNEFDRTLIVDLGDLKDDEEGTFLVQGEVLGRFNNQDMTVTVAEGTYDHPTIENAQGSSIAYALNTILDNRATLGAFVFGAGFFPGLFGWLILLLLILLIIWISRRIYNDHQDRKTNQKDFQIN